MTLTYELFISIFVALGIQREMRVSHVDIYDMLHSNIVFHIVQ